MSFKDISYLELWLPLVWRSGTICANLVDCIKRNNCFLEFGPVVQEMSLKDISYLELWQPLSIRAILVDCIMRNNSMKLF